MLLTEQVCLSEVNILQWVIDLSPLLGSFIGALAAVLAVYVGLKLRTNRNRKKLRKALLSDLETSKYQIDQLMEISNQYSISGIIPAQKDQFLSTTVFDSLISEVGVLSEEEIDKTIKLYRLIEHTRVMVDQFIQNRNQLKPVQRQSKGKQIKHNLSTISSMNSELQEVIQKNLQPFWISFSQKVFN